MRIALVSVVCTLAGLAFGQYGVDREHPDERQLTEFQWEGRARSDREAEEYADGRFDDSDRDMREFDEDRYFVVDLDELAAIESEDMAWREIELEGMLDEELSMRDERDGPSPPNDFDGPRRSGRPGPGGPPHRGQEGRGPEGRGPHSGREGRDDGPPPPPERRPPRRTERDDFRDDARGDHHRGPRDGFRRGGEMHADGCPHCRRLQAFVHKYVRQHSSHRNFDRRDFASHNLAHRGGGYGRAHFERGHHRGGCPLCDRRGFDRREGGRGGDRFGYHHSRFRSEFGKHGGSGHKRFASQGDFCPHCERDAHRGHHGKGPVGKPDHHGPKHAHGGPRGSHPAGHGDHPPHHAGPHHLFVMLDADKDGKLSKDEVLNLHADQDADKDGFVSLQEIEAHGKGAHKPPQIRPKQGHPSSVDRKEGGPKGEKRPKGIGDKPHHPPHGRLPHAGRGPMGIGGGRPPFGHGPWGMIPPGQILEKIFKEVDADGNGSVTKEEIAEAVWKKAGAADTDKDGAISKAEAENHLKEHFKKMRSQGDGKPRPQGDRKPGDRAGKKAKKPEGKKPKSAKPKEPPRAKPEEEKADINEQPAVESARQESGPVTPPVAVETPASAETPAATETPVTETPAEIAPPVVEAEVKPETSKPAETPQEPAALPSVNNESPTQPESAPQEASPAS